MDYLSLPMPSLWLLLAGLIFWRWRALSRALMVLGTVLLMVLSLPIVGRGLAMPLRAGAVPHNSIAEDGQAAVIVPTGGAFSDGTGRWWPTRSSLVRGQAGLVISEVLDLPMIVSGGPLAPGQPPESETLAAVLGWDAKVTLEPTGRNSSETARAVAALLPSEGATSVVLVTSPNHIARMRAALRHQGLDVVATPAPLSPPLTGAAGSGTTGLGLRDFLPSATGLKLSRAALYEYAGLASYLLSGRIDLADL